MRPVAWAAAAILAAAAPTGATACRQALAIGLDRSGSVDKAEERLMAEGMADALTDPAVQEAFFVLSDPVDIAIYEWSGPRYQRLILDWTTVDTAATLDRIAAILRDRSPVQPPTETAVGSAMVFAEGLLAARAGCGRLTLDLAGDGKSNSGPDPAGLPFAPAGRTATVNALAIGVPEGRGGDVGVAELSAWYLRSVVRGPGGFVEVALGFEDFRDAMARKLLREMAVQVTDGRGPAPVMVAEAVPRP